MWLEPGEQGKSDREHAREALRAPRAKEGLQPSF